MICFRFWSLLCVLWNEAIKLTVTNIYNEVNEDSEDSSGISFLLPSNHSTSCLSICLRDNPDISGGKFSCSEGEENSLRKIFWLPLISDAHFSHFLRIKNDK